MNNELPDKGKSIPKTQTATQEKAKFTPTTLSPKSPGPKRPWLLILLVFILLIAAASGWLLFALNRPGIEISNGPTPTPVMATPSLQPPVSPNTRTATTPVSAAPGQQARPSTAATTGPKIQGYGVVISKVLNMRSAPNTEATVIKSLKSGDIVELTSRNGGWYQTIDGFWISASFLEVRQTRPEAESYARELASS